MYRSYTKYVNINKTIPSKVTIIKACSDILFEQIYQFYTIFEIHSTTAYGLPIQKKKLKTIFIKS